MKDGNDRRCGTATWIDGGVARMAAVAALGTVAVAVAVGLRVDWTGFLAIPAASALFLPALLLMRRAGARRAEAALVQLLAMLWLSVPVLVLSYAVMRTGAPLADGMLARLDAAIGFTPHRLVAAVGSSPAAAFAMALAYASFSAQILLIAPILTLSGERERGDRFIVAFGVTTFLCIGISGAFPAIGTFAFHGLSPDVTGAIPTGIGLGFLDSFEAVRGDPDFVLKAGAAAGIVTFPSIHASTAMLCAWAMGSRPFLRWPFLALNIMMFLSAITHGAHYLVDVLAGGGVALAVIAAMNGVRAVRPAGIAPAATRSPGVPA